VKKRHGGNSGEYWAKLIDGRPFARIMAEDYFASERDFDKGGSFHAISALDEAGHDTSALPYSIRVLLEGALRNCDGFLVTKEDVISNSIGPQTFCKPLSFRKPPASPSANLR
jgi:hypothetical protein